MGVWCQEGGPSRAEELVIEHDDPHLGQPSDRPLLCPAVSLELGDVSLVSVPPEGLQPAPNVNIQKTKILASSPITSWQIDGETVETV